MPRPLAGSASLPVLPAAGRASNTPTAAMMGKSYSQLLIHLEEERATLRSELQQEKAKFGAMFLKDMRSPSRRRLEPMKKLLFEQSQTTSSMVTKASAKQHQLNQLLQRVIDDDTVQELRMCDVLRLKQNLEYLEDQLAEAEADATEACDREDTYSMMEQRLQSLVAQDQSRINEIQRVIDESVLRLGQWHAVSKELSLIHI